MNVFERLLPRVGQTVLGRYRLERELGRGGFGVVYQATQISIGQTVAVKVLLPHILSNQELVDRFAREVAVARDLQHPNTIRIFDYDRTEEGLPFYAMEFVTGRALLDDLAEHGGMPEARARHIVLQVLKSLAEAHSKGVVHRDLKPANIMLCEIFGELDFAKVLDFGIAKALTGDNSHATKTGMLLGSPPYMSPEQTRALKDLDGRSDLYSVGLILAECLTGAPVIEVGDLGQVLSLHLSPEPLSFAPRVQSSPLWPVIACATAKDRNQRYANASDMRAHLESLDLPAGFAVVVPGGRYGAPAGTPLPSEGRPGTPVPSGPWQVSALGPTQPEVARAATPQPAAPGMAISGQLYIPPMAGEGEAAPAKRKAGLSVPLLLVLLLVLGGGAAVVVVVMGGGEGEENVRTAATSAGEAQPEVRQTAAAVTEAGAHIGTSTNEAELVAVRVPNGVETPDEDPRRVAEAAGVTLAQSAVYASLLPLHELRFGGMEDVTVRYGETVLGVTPFSVGVPRSGREVVLVLERRGYRSQELTVRLSRQEPVEVSLSRERREEAETQVEVPTGPVVEDPPPFVIPEVTIH